MIPNLTIIIPDDEDLVVRKLCKNRQKNGEIVGDEWALHCTMTLAKHNRYEELICRLSQYYQELYEIIKKGNEIDPPRKAYSYYFKKKREILDGLICFNNLCGFDIAKFLGKMWRETISPERKQLYYSLEKEDQKRYDDELGEMISKRNRMMINIEKLEEMIRRFT